MGAVVFDNLVFDSWLTKKSEEILYKVDREKITTEEMLILILKAQTNHSHHMDVKFREEFRKVNNRIDQIELKVDDRFEKMWNFQKCQAGLIFAMLGGLYLKLFLG